MVGDYAYIILESALWIVDISDPTTPLTNTIYELSSSAKAIVVDGDYAYLACNTGLHIIDVSDFTNLIEVGSYETPEAAKTVALFGDYAYIAIGDQGVQVVNVSNPTSPTRVSAYDTPGYARDVSAIGGYLYIADGLRGLRIVDVSDPITLVEIGAYKVLTLGGGSAIVVSGNYAYITDGYYDLHVLDISSPMLPVQVSTYTIPGTAQDIVVSGDYAYVAAGDGGLRIVDVSSPTTLTETSFYTTSAPVNGVVVMGNYAYVVAGEAGLRIVDISDSAAPTEVGFLEPEYGFQHIDAAGDYVYVDEYGTLHVLDVSNPVAPAVAGVQYSSVSVYVSRDLVFQGGYVYAVSGYCQSLGGWWYCVGELATINVMSPTHPTIVSSIQLHQEGYSGFVNSLAATDGYLYGARYYQDDSMVTANHLCVRDVSNPVSPGQAVCQGTLGAYVDVAVTDDYIYVVGGGELFILRENFSVTGQVVDWHKSPFTGATISTNLSVSATTNANGDYTFANLSRGTLTFTPTCSGYVFWPPTRTVRLAGHITDQDFIVSPAPVSITLRPGTAYLPASLVYTDTQNLPTRLDFPRGVVTQTTTILLTPTVALGVPGFTFAGHAFELAAVRGGEPVPDFSFEKSVTVTIQYSEKDVQVVSDEAQVALWWWEGNVWKDAAQTCTLPSAYTRDAINNVLSVPICRLGLFGMFGPTNQMYLPLILRN